jgi:hypothetical protein
MILRREKYYFINVDNVPSTEVVQYIEKVKQNLSSQDDEIIKLRNFFVPVRNQDTKVVLIEYSDNNTTIARIL